MEGNKILWHQPCSSSVTCPYAKAFDGLTQVSDKVMCTALTARHMLITVEKTTKTCKEIKPLATVVTLLTLRVK